jgi:ankyrin repeat protein
MACETNRVDVVKVLIDAGVDRNLARDDGTHPLLVASEYGHEQVVAVLLKSGVDIDRARDDGWTALHVACQHGHSTIASMLLDFGANKNKVTNKERTTPLIMAAELGFFNIAKVVPTLLTPEFPSLTTAITATTTTARGPSHR